jgi:tetratricopeptide (TPR) repeat protein
MARCERHIRVDRRAAPGLNRSAPGCRDRNSERARVWFAHALLLKKLGKTEEASLFLGKVIQLLSGERGAEKHLIIIESLEVLGALQIERGEPASALECARSAESIRSQLLVSRSNWIALREAGILLDHLMARAWLEIGEVEPASRALRISEGELTTLSQEIELTPKLIDLRAHQLRLELAANAADPERAVDLGERLVALRRELVTRFGRTRSHLEKLADAISWHADCLLIAELLTEAHVFYKEAVRLRRSLIDISGADNQSLIALSATLLASAQFHLYSGDQKGAEELAWSGCQFLQQVWPEQLDGHETYPAFAETSVELANLLLECGHLWSAKVEQILLAAVRAGDQLPFPESDIVKAIRANLRSRAGAILQRAHASGAPIRFSEEARRLVA